MVSKRGTRYRCSHPGPLSALSQRAHGDPRLTRMTFIGLPGLKMIARGENVEVCLFSVRAEVDKLRHGKLFVRQHERDHSLAQTASPDTVRSALWRRVAAAVCFKS